MMMNVVMMPSRPRHCALLLACSAAVSHALVLSPHVAARAAISPRSTATNKRLEEFEVVCHLEANAAKEEVALLRMEAAVLAEEAEAARLRMEVANLAQKRRAEAERQQLELEEELERRRVEQLQREEQRQQAEASHKARMAAIATKKARDLAAQLEREAQHALLLEDELEAKLAVEAVDLATRKRAAQQALAATEAAEAVVASGLAMLRPEHLNEIAALEERARSLDHVRALFLTYDAQCSGCHRPVDAAEDAVEVERANQEFIKARVERELKESEAKLAKQAAAISAKQTELRTLGATFAAAEQRAVQARLLRSSEATAQALKLEQAARATLLRSEEQERQEEALAESSFLLERQRGRAEATLAATADAASSLDEDKARIGKLDEEVRALELAEKHAALQATLVLGGFDTDTKASTQLKAVQERMQRALTSMLADAPLLLPMAADAPGMAAEAPGMTAEAPGMRELNDGFKLLEAGGGLPPREIEELQSLVRSRHGETDACLREVQVRRAQLEADTEAARSWRKDQVSVLNVERTALAMGMAEREALLAERHAQLKHECTEANATAQSLHGIEQCIRMLAEEVEACQKYERRCRQASEAADVAEGAATEALETLRRTREEKLRQARAMLVSETEAREQNRQYAQTLRTQLKATQVAIREQPLAAEFEWKGEGMPPAQAGSELLSRNGVENARWLGQLEARRAQAGERLDKLRRRLEGAEKQAAKESKRLAEQRAQQLTVLHEIERSEQLLEAKSPRSPPSPPEVSAKAASSMPSPHSTILPITATRAGRAPGAAGA